MADQRALGDAHDRDQGVQPLLLLGAAQRGSQAHAEAGVNAPGQLGARERAAGWQALPQRIRGLIWRGVVVAQGLVHHAQVEPELVRPRAAAEHAAGEQHRVVTRRVGLSGDGGHACAPALAVQQRDTRLGDQLGEQAAQALGVFGRSTHRHAALPVGRAGPGMASAHHDGPALQVLRAALGAWFAEFGAAVGMQHEHAAPCGRHRDPVVRAGGVGAGQAVGVGGQAGGAGRGCGMRQERDQQRAGDDVKDSVHVDPGKRGARSSRRGDLFRSCPPAFGLLLDLTPQNTSPA